MCSIEILMCFGEECKKNVLRILKDVELVEKVVD